MPSLPERADWEAQLDDLENFLVPRAVWLENELADWTDDERAWLTEKLPLLTQQGIVEAEYLYGDDDVERERSNRRLLELLERVDRIDGLMDDIRKRHPQYLTNSLREGLQVAPAEFEFFVQRNPL